MKNTFIHHIIELKANHHESIVNDIDDEMTPKDWMFLIHSKHWDWESFLYGFGYNEAMIGSRRDMTQKEYKQIMHYQRFEAWEFDKTHDNAYSDEYEPQYNPGGGPYRLES